MPRSRRTKDVVAYLRVSTKRQGNSGIGLEGQAAGIDAFAKEAGLQVVATYQDVASAVGTASIGKRDGAQLALKHAETAGLPIIVYTLDRLTRDIPTYADLSRAGHKVISAADGVINKSERLATVARAQIVAQAISEKTREAMQKLKADGVLLGNRTNLSDAQLKGSAANRDRAEAKAVEIAAFLGSCDDAAAMSAAQIVDLLNRDGILTGSQRQWTLPAIRRPLQRARQLIAADAQPAYKSDPNYGRF